MPSKESEIKTIFGKSVHRKNFDSYFDYHKFQKTNDATNKSKKVEFKLHRNKKKHIDKIDEQMKLPEKNNKIKTDEQMKLPEKSPERTKKPKTNEQI